MASNSNPLISVTMNCFNSDKYLRESIESVLAQTYPNWELIFWDNQSTDKSADIFKSYNDNRFHYFYAPKHTNLGEARNQAVEKAKGEWIAFLDCDDLWLSEKLEKQVKIINENEDINLGLIYGRVVSFGDGILESELVQDYKGKNLPEERAFEKLLIEGNFIPLLSAVILKKAYWDVGGIPMEYKQAEDYYIFIAICAKYPVKCLQSVCCKYRIHSSNLSKKQLIESFEEPVKIINLWLNRLDSELQYRIKKGVLIRFQTYVGMVLIFKGRINEGILRIIRQGSILIAIRKTIKFCYYKITFKKNGIII